MFQGLQRIKGAIDSRIAEEQARQKAAQGSPGRSTSKNKRPPARTASPATRARNRSQDIRNADPLSRGPDPKEFEQPEFLIEDEDGSSRAVSPRPPEKAEEEGIAGRTSESAESQGQVGNSAEKASEKLAALELPTDVRAKLRKLDKLESRYQGTCFAHIVRASLTKPRTSSVLQNCSRSSLDNRAF
jgi:hypothetical protein